MRRESLTRYDDIPESMIQYLRYNGPHFNKKLLEFALSKMYKVDNMGRKKPIPVYTKEQVQNLLNSNNIRLQNDQLYDSTYVANMCKADFYGSSISDDSHMALYIKDTIDDPDGYDGIVFNRWYADMCYKGIPVDWEEMI